MRYTDVDHTYVAQAVQRIEEALEITTKIPVMVEPPQEEVEKARGTPGSKWVVYASGMSNTDQNADHSTQVWSVASQLIYKPAQQQYDGTIYTAAHILVPKMFNYFQGHKRLINATTQEPIPYLRTQQTTVTLSSINDGGQPGFIITHRLYFALSIEQED